MSAESEAKLRDIVIWFKEHQKEASDIEKRLELQERVIDNLIWYLSYLVEDIQRLEHRHPSQTSIVLPRLKI